MQKCYDILQSWFRVAVARREELSDDFAETRIETSYKVRSEQVTGKGTRVIVCRHDSEDLPQSCRLIGGEFRSHFLRSSAVDQDVRVGLSCSN